MIKCKAASTVLADGQWESGGVVIEVHNNGQIINQRNVTTPTSQNFATKEEADRVFINYCVEKGWLSDEK